MKFWKLASTGIFALLLGAVLHTAVTAQDLLTIERVPTADPAPKGIESDYYYSLEIVDSQLDFEDRRNGFIRTLRQLFFNDSRRMMMTVRQSVTRQNKRPYAVSRVVNIYDRSGNTQHIERRLGDQLIPYRRYQYGDRIEVSVTLSDISEEQAGLVARIMPPLEQVNLIDSFTLNTVGVFADVLNAFTQTGNNVSTSTLVLGGLEDLTETDYLVVLPATLQEAFKAAAGNLRGAAVEQFFKDNAEAFPNYLLFRVVRERSLYDPTQVLGGNSTIRQWVAADLTELTDAKNNQARARICQRIRRNVRQIGPLTSVDESFVAIAALKEINFRPDATSHHYDEGCLTEAEVNHALDRFRALEFGACNRNPLCRSASRVFASWARNRASSIADDTISWFITLDGAIIDGSGSEQDFLRTFAIRPDIGSYRQVGEHEYATLASHFGEKDGQRCTYDVELVLEIRNDSEGNPKILSVSGGETNRTLDGRKPSERYRSSSIPNCGSL